jgi:hypothetical protein
MGNNVIINANGAITAYGLLTHRQSLNMGETLNYTTNYAGGGQNGWFWFTNPFWYIGSVSYLTIAINSNNGAVWFGRAFLGGGGGFYSIINDYRTPNGGANTINVVDYWGPTGENTLRILFDNASYRGSFTIKVSG